LIKSIKNKINNEPYDKERVINYVKKHDQEAFEVNEDE
jgi:hypothetical protein